MQEQERDKKPALLCLFKQVEKEKKRTEKEKKKQIHIFCLD